MNFLWKDWKRTKNSVGRRVCGLRFGHQQTIDSVPWPASGEIDIMEHINTIVIYGTTLGQRRTCYEGRHAFFYAISIPCVCH